MYLNTFWNYILNNFICFDVFYLYLKGERTISAVDGRVPKYEVPILDAMKKKIDTDKIERKINIQDWGSKSFKRFQIGGVSEGYFEYQ